MDQINQIKCEQFSMDATENEDMCKYAARFDAILTILRKAETCITEIQMRLIFAHDIIMSKFIKY